MCSSDLKFPPASRSGNYPVICEDVRRAYGQHVVFHDVNLTINRGEKVTFVGKNGEGKSTLVKCIMGEIDFDGKLTIGHNVQIGYFAQNQAQMLDENMTVFDTIDRVATGDIRLKIRDILGAFMFGGGASDKKVKVLSGGERTRLAMIKFYYLYVFFLIVSAYIIYFPFAALAQNQIDGDRKSTRLNSSHMPKSRMPSSA